MLRSIVFLPATDPHIRQWLLVCAEYCALRRYEIVAVVHVWADVVRLIADGRASRIIAGRRDHLPEIEIVTEQTTPEVAARRRPTRRVRGQGASG